MSPNIKRHLMHLLIWKNNCWKKKTKYFLVLIPMIITPDKLRIYGSWNKKSFHPLRIVCIIIFDRSFYQLTKKHKNILICSSVFHYYIWLKEIQPSHIESYHEAEIFFYLKVGLCILFIEIIGIYCSMKALLL